MSVLVIVKIHADVPAFLASLKDRAAEYKAISDEAKTVGAIRHRFGTAGDFVLVVDEWESEADFRAFFGNPDLKKFIASVGADQRFQPEITVTQAVTSDDQF
jgi:quinol monooxygenase YgiN